jgi:hypothetical protein
MIIKALRATQSVVQVGIRWIKTIEEECVASVYKGKRRKKAQKKTQQSSKPTSKEKEEVDYYALKKIHALVMWYLPVIDRLRCLFANPKDAKFMSWHASDEHKNDGKLWHLANQKEWKEFNDNHRDFAEEPRNVRFTLNINGMNPFAERSSKHSTCSVILTIYNLLPWLIRKRKYILLTILISIPTQPEVDMDVFLEPLMEGMKILWETAVQILDEYCKDSFMLRAIILLRSMITLFSSHYQASLRKSLVAQYALMELLMCPFLHLRR